MPPHPSDLASIRGNDVPWPKWAGGEERAGAWDSVVVNSTGVCALTFAGRAARSHTFADRVEIVGEPVAESRRLVGGVTLRARTVDYYANAMGTSRERVLQELFGSDGWRQAETDRQIAALCSGTPASGFRIVRQACFMDAARSRPRRSPRIPLAYGVRNTRLRGMLQTLAVEAGARLHPQPEATLAGLRGHARGERPLVVNGTPRPLAETPVEVPPPAPSQFIAAVQVTFRSNRSFGALAPHASFVCWVPHGGALTGLDMGVYYPFQDALSPTADYYGIFYRAVAARDAKTRAEEIEAHLEASVLGIGEAIGLEPVDVDETRGAAIVPVSPWRGVRNSQAGVLDLSRIAGAGSPIITGDGMTRSAVAGLVGAESLLAGRDPAGDVDRALRRYRQLNWELHLALTRLARPATALMRLFPSVVLFRQTRSYGRDMWAGAY